MPSDVLDRANTIIDLCIDQWEEERFNRPLTTLTVRQDVSAFFTLRKQYNWYVEHFTESGWNKLINARLSSRGYRKYGWGWGGKQR